MRKKAEKKIREAVDRLDSRENHRLDRIRAKAGLHPKVFDKTILDMARVGTIELSTGDLTGLRPAEISALVRRGETVYVTFNFTEAGRKYELPPEPADLKAPPAVSSRQTSNPETSSAAPGDDARMVILRGLLRGEWELFAEICRTTENKGVEEKLEDLIRRYIGAAK